MILQCAPAVKGFVASLLGTSDGAGLRLGPCCGAAVTGESGKLLLCGVGLQCL